MKMKNRSAFTLCLLAVSLAGLSGCKSSVVGATSNVDISPDPPTFNERFQARNPRVCAQLRTPPTPAQAKELVQCAWEGKSILSGMNPSLGLITDLQVQMSSPRAFKMEFNNPSDVDTSGMVYDLRGQGTSWACAPAGGGIYAAGENCMRSDAVPKGIGECWRTTFGDWKCEMTVGGGPWVTRVKGPMTF